MPRPGPPAAGPRPVAKPTPADLSKPAPAKPSPAALAKPHPADLVKPSPADLARPALADPARPAPVPTPGPSPVAPIPKPVPKPQAPVAETAPVHDPEEPAPPVRKPDGPRGTGPGEAASRTREKVSPEEREAERGLRGLVGSGSSQVSVRAAMRARDASRPTDQDMAEAQERLAIVRRNWVPREELPARGGRP